MKPTALLKRWVPAFDWLADYNRQLLAQDGFAAVIVTLMLIPQSLAYALLAGLPPQVGLYASIPALLAYALFGSSRTLSVGPVAVVSLMTAAAIGRIASSGLSSPTEAAVVLALLSGLMLLAMAVLRLGFLANLLSHPVIAGFILASALLIAASQLKHLLGIPLTGDTLPELLASLPAALPALHLPTVLLGVGATVALFWMRKGLAPLLRRAGLSTRMAAMLAKTGPVMVIIATTAAVIVGHLDADGVAVVGKVPAGLPPPTLPVTDPALWLALMPAAALISLVGFVESVSVAQTLAAKRRERVDPNQELVGLGAANLAAALGGGYPVTGGFARSVVNFDAGARTQMAGILTAIGIALVALLLTPAFERLPQAALAATIIVSVLSLVDLQGLRHVWRYSRSDFTAMAVTIVLVLMVGVEAGILAGVAAALLMYIWRSSRPHIAIVGQVPGTEHFRNIHRHHVLTSPHVLSVRVDESLYFANARFLEDWLYDAVASRPQVRDVVLVCPAINTIDASALDSLGLINDRLQQAGVRFHLSEVKGPVHDRLQRSSFLEKLSGQVFLSQHQAMSQLDPALTAQADAGAPPAPPHRHAPRRTVMTPFRHLPPDLYIHGQPTPEQIAALPSQGIASVINLRGTGEDSGFDEPAAVAAAGLAYHALPVAGPQDLTADTVARFSDLLAQARSKGPVLIHCASANRVGALLALEKGWLHGLASNDAVEIGRQAGLTGLEPVVSRLLEDGPN